MQKKGTFKIVKSSLYNRNNYWFHHQFYVIPKVKWLRLTTIINAELEMQREIKYCIFLYKNHLFMNYKFEKMKVSNSLNVISVLLK